MSQCWARERHRHQRPRRRSRGRRRRHCWIKPALSRSAIAGRSDFIPARGVDERTLADAAQLASLADDAGGGIVILAKQRF